MTEVRITIRVRCDGCGGVAELTMSPEAALVHARDVESAARGLRPVELVVRGQG